MGNDSYNSKNESGLFVQGYAFIEKTGEIAAVMSNRLAGINGASTLVGEKHILPILHSLETSANLQNAKGDDIGKTLKWLGKDGFSDGPLEDIMTLRAALGNIHSIAADPSRKSSLQHFKSWEEADVNKFIVDGKKLGDLPEGNQPQDLAHNINDGPNKGLVFMPSPILPAKTF